MQREGSLTCGPRTPSHLILNDFNKMEVTPASNGQNGRTSLRGIPAVRRVVHKFQRISILLLTEYYMPMTYPAGIRHINLPIHIDTTGRPLHNTIKSRIIRHPLLSVKHYNK